MGQVKGYWRDVLAILTVLLVLGSLLAISYGVGKTNAIAEQQKIIAREQTEQINCIVKFFSTSDRATAKITDIEKCVIVRQPVQ